MKSMPFGLPKEGDKGLDYTHTWGRTYWGGAIFCLLADIEIRQQTNNKNGPARCSNWPHQKRRQQ